MVQSELVVACPIRVQFRDVDMHGHVHNAVYLSYVEAAINEFLRKFDLKENFSPEGNDHSYHVKKVELVFDRPAQFDDLLVVQVALVRIGTTSLTFESRIVRDPEMALCVKATVVWVCVNLKTRQPAPVPTETREALDPFIIADKDPSS